MPSKVARPTKRSPAGVISTRTAWPPRVASRARSIARYAAIPPLTPSRIRAIAGRSSELGAVVVLELARGELLEGDRQVVPRLGLHHRRCVLLVAALAEGPVIA